MPVGSELTFACHVALGEARMTEAVQQTLDNVAGSSSGLLPLLKRSMRAHSLLFVIIIGYVLAYSVLVTLHPQIEASDVLLGVGMLLVFSVPFMLMSLIMMRFYHLARYVKPERPIPALGRDLVAFFKDRRRLANGLPMYLLFVAFGHVFVEFKGSIYSLNGFKWDAAIAQADAALHFGTQPWEWLQPLLGFPIVTFLINVVYNMWFFVMWISWLYFGFAREGSVVRTRFFLTYFLMWIIGGSAMAIGLSSAGPAYYGRIVEGIDPFAGLMSYLNAANTVYPIWAVDLQEVLWQGLMSNGVLGEISAMPSLHNGTALLFALAAYQVSRFWGRMMLANTLIILIGSVHLGWHYALDGYVAWVLCLIMWQASAPIARWWHRQPQQVEFDAALAAHAR
jgi:hypothetical protein